MPPTPNSAAPRLAETLGRIVALLRRVAAPVAAKNPTAARLMHLLHHRLGRIVTLFAALAARAAAGRLRPSSPPKPRAPRAKTKPPAAPPERLPSHFGWATSHIQGAAAAASQLRHLLADPEMQSLLEAAPQATRLLRPLCRMLGLEELSQRPPKNWAARPVRRVFPPDPPPPPAATLATLPYRTVARKLGVAPAEIALEGL